MKTERSPGASRPLAPVLRLVPRPPPSVDIETVECLKVLLHQARQGRVVGIAFCAVLGNRNFITDTAGEAKRHPTWARGMVSTLDDKLQAAIHGW